MGFYQLVLFHDNPEIIGKEITDDQSMTNNRVIIRKPLDEKTELE